MNRLKFFLFCSARQARFCPQCTETTNHLSSVQTRESPTWELGSEDVVVLGGYSYLFAYFPRRDGELYLAVNVSIMIARTNENVSSSHLRNATDRIATDIHNVCTIKHSQMQTFSPTWTHTVCLIYMYL